MNPIQSFISQIAGMAKTAQQPGNNFGDFLNQIPGVQGIQNARQGIHNASHEIGQKEAKLFGYAPPTPQQEQDQENSLGMVAGVMGGGEGLPGLGSEADALAAKGPGLAKKLAMKVNQTDKVQLPGDDPWLYGKEQRVQQTLNDQVPGNSLQEKFKNVGPTIGKLGDQIKQFLQQNGTDVTMHDVRQYLQDRIQPLVTSGTLHQSQANTALEGYLGRMYNAAHPGQNMPPIQNTMDAAGNIQGLATQKLPDTVTSQDLYNMHLIGNKAANSLYDATGNVKGNLSPAEQTTLALRGGINDILKDTHPEVADLLQKQSDLYSASPALSKLRNTNTNIGVNLPVNLGGAPVNVNLPFSGTVRRMAGAALNSDKLPVAAAAGAGGLGLLGAQQAMENGIPQKVLNAGMNAIGYIPKSANDEGSNPNSGINNNNGGQNIQGQGNHNDSLISQSYSNIKPDPHTGKIELPQTPPQGQNQRHYMTEQDYLSGLQKIGNQYTFGTPAYNNAKVQLDSQRAEEKDQAAQVFKGNNVQNFMVNAPQYHSDGKDLQDTLSGLPSGFWNSVGKVGSIRAYHDPAYAKELQQIDNFNNEFTSAYKSVTGEDPGKNQLLDTANSPQQAAQKYLAMMQWMSGTYGKYLSPYLALTSSSGGQSQYGAPQQAYLPPIQDNPTPDRLPQNMLQAPGPNGLGPIQPGAFEGGEK